MTKLVVATISFILLCAGCFQADLNALAWGMFTVTTLLVLCIMAKYMDPQ